MTPSMLDAFNDELTKIAMEKQALSFQANIGRPIVKAGIAAGQWAKRQAYLTAHAGREFLNNPGYQMKEGLKMTFQSPPTGPASAKKLSLVGRNPDGSVNALETGLRGLWVATTANDAINAVKKKDVYGQNAGRGERIGRFVAGTTTSLGTMKSLGMGWKGLLPGMALGAGASYLGGKAGKQVDKAVGKLRGKGPASAPPVVGNSQPATMER
jgi:hypothetical protein